MSDRQSTTGTKQKQPRRSPEEERLLALMAEQRGRKFVDENEELILEQARQMGELD